MKKLINSLLSSDEHQDVQDSSLLEPANILGHNFNTWGLLKSALTHTSIENPVGKSSSFERMEFLGDAILGLVISELLFAKFPDYNEGQLSKLKAKVVSRKFLAHVAENINLGEYLIISHEAERNGGRNNKSILADTMEAIICAIYLDAGIKSARSFIKRLIFKNYEKILGKGDLVNYKSKLQEYTQLKNQNLPEYKIINESGPDHDKMFSIEVLIDKVPSGLGKGHTKKEAQQQAAKIACQKLNL